MHYAHSLPDKSIPHWHKLDQHLFDTAKLAEEFSKGFAPGWGYLAGLWHDLGKYQAAFQRRIGADPNAHTKEERVDHSSVGALLAQQASLHPLSFVIAAHHAGLSDIQYLLARLQAKQALLATCRNDGMPPLFEAQPRPAIPSFLRNDPRKIALWIRFIFSALVDADFLDTERFYDGSPRSYDYLSLAELRTRLVDYLNQKRAASQETAINQLRRRILAACKDAALLRPGAYTLTAPTGAGKTLSAMQFALDHALAHGKNRVIVVIPYTSIIDQTASVYKEILGERNVIEHHSNVDPDAQNRVSRLASENWDAPIVVTTGVQFFESLYANRPSRCRKLHRIANSVVILDEVQTVPAGLLQPIRDILAQLVEDYGVTCVLCTATQPALTSDAHEIIPNVEAEFNNTKGRCSYRLPTSLQSTTWESLAGEISQHKQALAIVNKRDDAQTLAQLIGQNAIHLSARMCPAHRKRVIAEIKERLSSAAECLVISTQLIEAGVDVDFPVVFRAMAGADSLAQAGGRCNREGLRTSGDVFIFQPPTEPPRGVLRQAKQRTEAMFREGILNLTTPATFSEYFRRLYSGMETDPGVLEAERNFEFAKSAQLFEMIEDTGEPVLAPYGKWRERLSLLRNTGITRYALRGLQPYMVNLYPHEIISLKNAGAIVQLDTGLWAVTPGSEYVYSERFGFSSAGEVIPNAEQFVV